jgi:hypothetical protein
MDLLAALQKNVIALSTMMDETDYPDIGEMDYALIYFGNCPSQG